MNLISVDSPFFGNLAVITGGSRGIGERLIHEFASRGYNISTYGRSEKVLEALKQSVEEKYGVKVHYQVADASDKNQVKAFGSFCQSLSMPVRVLINNAGRFEPGDLMVEPEGNMRDMMSVNFESAYELTRCLVPLMKADKKGHIINICSVASLKAYPAGGSYAVSKAALMSFSQNLREELKVFGIKVTSVFPGATWTDSWSSSGIPEDRFMPVSDLVKMIWAAHDLSGRSVVEEIVLRPQLGDI
ncbi:MAG: SDR family NAD(P)-dependent oxidoreductase [Cyclobacteriaceae bacterium]